jgi:hypothetical protein
MMCRLFASASGYYGFITGLSDRWRRGRSRQLVLMVFLRERMAHAEDD